MFLHAFEVISLVRMVLHLHLIPSCDSNVILWDVLIKSNYLGFEPMQVVLIDLINVGMGNALAQFA
jgi:hypothetical protein